MSNSERRKTKVETPPIVSKTRRTQRRPIEARLQGHPLRVNAADLPRRRFLHLAAGTAALPAVSRIAWGQAYPTRPITIVVPFAAGGGLDVIGRILAARMRASLGQPVIIENVSGANGSIGVGRVARAASDGYTLVISNWQANVANGAIYPLQYDLLKDLEPVSLIVNNPSLIVAKKAMPANDLAGLVAWLKTNPEKASLGTGGVGSIGHIGGILFQNITGTRFQFVPYRGAGPAMQDLIAGQIDMMIESPPIVLTQLRSGSIKVYAVAAKSRLAAAPDIPTVDEAGLSGFYFSSWVGLWSSKGTPKNIIMKLNSAAVDALADPAVRERFAGLGSEIFPREQRTPGALAALQKVEIEKWWPIIKAAGIKAE
jgi:tripartite-type tricarboxylate transporter receptor subunit TctC